MDRIYRCRKDFVYLFKDKTEDYKSMKANLLSDF